MSRPDHCGDEEDGEKSRDGPGRYRTGASDRQVRPHIAHGQIVADILDEHLNRDFDEHDARQDQRTENLAGSQEKSHCQTGRYDEARHQVSKGRDDGKKCDEPRRSGRRELGQEPGIEAREPMQTQKYAQSHKAQQDDRGARNSSSVQPRTGSCVTEPTSNPFCQEDCHAAADDHHEPADISAHRLNLRFVGCTVLQQTDPT